MIARKKRTRPVANAALKPSPIETQREGKGMTTASRLRCFLHVNCRGLTQAWARIGTRPARPSRPSPVCERMGERLAELAGLLGYGKRERSAFILSTLIALASICLAQSTRAASISLDDFTGNEIVETFDYGVSFGSTLVLDGVTYSSGSSNALVLRPFRSRFFQNFPQATASGKVLETTDSGDAINIIFSDPVIRFGMFLSIGTGTNFRISAFDENSQLIGSSDFTAGTSFNAKAIFAGLEFDREISSVTVEKLSSNIFVTMIDDLRYEPVPVSQVIPTPSAALAGAVGLGLLSLRRRRGEIKGV